uniref:Ribosome binding protein 1a n=1 Tax=Amphilophus citrinellus TaxID=61819 RepID=A0A3Q0RDF9_AMPCI
MDIYDPQTLGIMVFGGFMVISAVGIALVSTLSMKETSYEEALAKQRRELGKAQSVRTEKKKKDKVSEKKKGGKKREEKPNGKIPEQEKTEDAAEADTEADIVSEGVSAPTVAAASSEPNPVAEPSPAPSPKEKKKKKVAKVEPASTQPSVLSATAPAKSVSAPSKTAPVLEAVTKDVPVMAVPPVGSQQAPAVAKAQEPKKKASKKKAEPVAPVDSADAPLYLPYKALVSTISSMVFSEGEAHRLIEILSEKVGIIQDTWHMATQKGDPVAMLKKQLEEREKQLATEQEDASAVKNRLRELTKELSAEKAKVASVETRLSSQLSKREQEMVALQARMQASYQDHVAQTQRLNAKIVSLQDQLEKGPNAQLARLQQENTILRDALNQATSQAESKQNAELAKLRQECAKLTKEVGEKTESLLADEHIRKGLEAKVSAAEKQLSQLQELLEKLKEAEESHGSLQAECEQYRTVLAETEGMLKHLQKSVEEEELVWKSKMAKSEEQLQEVSDNTYVTLSCSLCSLCSFDTVRFLLSCQWITLFVVNFQAQKTVAELQAQLDLLKVSSESPQSDTEDVAQLKVCMATNSILFENSKLLFFFFKCLFG